MKDFDTWNQEKQTLHNSRTNVVFHEREIWWCSIGVNIGYEQDGKNDLFERPVVIIKKFNRDVAWVAPLTTKVKYGIYYHSIFHEDQEFSVILSQLRLLSTKRLRRYVRKISPHQFWLIRDKIKKLIP